MATEELDQASAEGSALALALRWSACSKPMRSRLRSLRRFFFGSCASHSWRRRTFQIARFDMRRELIANAQPSRKQKRARNVTTLPRNPQ